MKIFSRRVPFSSPSVSLLYAWCPLSLPPSNSPLLSIYKRSFYCSCDKFYLSYPTRIIGFHFFSEYLRELIYVPGKICDGNAAWRWDRGREEREYWELGRGEERDCWPRYQSLLSFYAPGLWQDYKPNIESLFHVTGTCLKYRYCLSLSLRRVENKIG